MLFRSVSQSRYLATNMQTTMKLVRDELDTNTTIINNHHIASNIELTATLDYQTPTPMHPNPTLETELRKTQTHITSTQTELTTHTKQDTGKNRQLFANESLLTPELPTTPIKPQHPIETATPTTPTIDPRTLDAMHFELHDLRELIKMQLNSIT